MKNDSIDKVEKPLEDLKSSIDNVQSKCRKWRNNVAKISSAGTRYVTGDLDWIPGMMSMVSRLEERSEEMKEFVSEMLLYIRRNPIDLDAIEGDIKTEADYFGRLENELSSFIDSEEDEDDLGDIEIGSLWDD